MSLNITLFQNDKDPVQLSAITAGGRQHESIMAYFDKLGNKMDHMHIIDGENGSDTHLIPGEGNIPIKEMLYEMKRIGYDKTATLELVTNYINEPRFYAKRAIDNMRELMAEAGIV